MLLYNQPGFGPLPTPKHILPLCLFSALCLSVFLNLFHTHINLTKAKTQACTKHSGEDKKKNKKTPTGPTRYPHEFLRQSQKEEVKRRAKKHADIFSLLSSNTFTFYLPYL